MSDTTWTREQAAAIRAAGHTLLEANAGTGKTTTVVGAILWRLGLDIGVDEDGAPIGPCPEDRQLTLDRVAAITFTEKAAYDLKRKLRDEIRARAPHLLWEIDRAAIGTIHSFCGDLLREHALRFGIDPGFAIRDEREALLEREDFARRVILDALARDDVGTVALVERATLTGFEHTRGAVDFVLDAFRDLRWHADRWRQWAPGDRLERAVLKLAAQCWTDEDDPPFELCDTLLRLARHLVAQWTTWLSEENARDFDALILDLRDFLTSQEMAPALAEVRRRIGLLIIDEFQDTDGAQRDIAFQIAGLGPAGGDGPPLLLVGDPKQSIYRFRGADITVWNEVQEVLGARGHRLALTRNFRSTPAVVEYVNRTCAPAFAATAAATRGVKLRNDVSYAGLEAARKAAPDEGVEWLVASGKAEERREQEARLVAARIRAVVVDEVRGDLDGITIVDPATREERSCRYRDVAILFRSRTPVPYLVDALDHYGVPYYLAGDAGLKDRLEVLDVLTLLRLLENPRDDLRAFAFLRSPFVGLRDEVIARMRLAAPTRSLLGAARAFLGDSAWFTAREHGLIAEVERAALGTGLAVVDELSRLPSRVPIHRLVEEALERTGYRLHLLLSPQADSKLANLERFVGLLEGYRSQTVGTFLEIWDRWEATDLGIPQAPLYSKDDDVVTLSTIHAAKGLEWPVVFLVDAHGALRDRAANNYWSDRELGPVLCPKKDDRGERTDLLQKREAAAEHAEEARLLYVATTRARDRLVIAGPTARAEGVAAWLGDGRDDTVTVSAKPAAVRIPEPPPAPELAWLDALVEMGVPPLAGEVRAGPVRYTRSATEIMTRARSRREWQLRYLHGVEPSWIFARTGEGAEVPAMVRGVVIHGVLERIREEADLAELLEVAIGALDSPELEERLGAGTAYRLALEEELRRVVASDEWRWYVEGEHWRELRFVHLRAPRRWRAGAFDLFRPGEPRHLIVDFKTHEIEAAAVESTAAHYAPQVAVYRAAARAAGRDALVRLHFTRPNRVWEAKGGVRVSGERRA